MLYDLGSISNRDCSLLYAYRILRNPSDFLSPIYTDSIPDVYEIQQGVESSVEFQGNRLWKFHLGEMKPDRIPYLEFEFEDNQIVQQSLLFLDSDNGDLLGSVQILDNPVLVKIYWVSSIKEIEDTLDSYLDAIRNLKNGILDFKNQLENLPNRGTSTIISGINRNLVQAGESSGEVIFQDSGYCIDNALISQQIVNPSQEILDLLPKRLNGNINLVITDQKYRILSNFSGYTIFICGNGDWLFRDCSSTINIFSANKSEITAIDCSLLYLRKILDIKIEDSELKVSRLLLDHTTGVGFQGEVEHLEMTNRSVFSMLYGTIKILDYLGPGCTFGNFLENPKINLGTILGNLQLDGLDGINSDISSEIQHSLYLGGISLGFNYNQNDFELFPKDFSDINLGNIHIQ